MIGPELEIQFIASVVAVACALPGVFLVLRKMAMMSDAISHSILFGIVVMFFITKEITSPLLLLGAAATGIITVGMVEMTHKTKLLKEDASIGIVFPLLFSIGVILISKYAGDVHLDSDAVLLGELAFAPFDRFVFLGIDIGPKSLIVMLVILVLNILFIAIFYKELKLTIFDPGLARALGFNPNIIHYTLMAFVSITAVGAFDAVGSILVVALMIGPPAIAYLITERLSLMLVLSAVLGVLSAVSGYWLARLFDVSIAGSMATMIGVLFVLTFLFSPLNGMIALMYRKRKQGIVFAARILPVHLSHHEGKPESEEENRYHNLDKHLHWNKERIKKIVTYAQDRKLIHIEDEMLLLTDSGREQAQTSITAS